MTRLKCAGLMTTVEMVAILTVMTGMADAACNFPEYLQRTDPWVGDYKGGQLVAYVKSTFISVSESYVHAPSHQFNKECVERAPDNKFLIRLKEENQPINYQCLQFLRRSENIVQIKTSARFERQSMEICKEEGMFIDPFPLIQMGQRPNSSIPCPFIGGYNFYAYFHHPNDSLVCSNNLLLMRMESECERGGGIVFDFREEHCVPKDHGLPRSAIQRAHCVAHWTQGSYTFIMLQHAERHDKWWCMRISDPLTDITMAYLWMQVVCDASPKPNSLFSKNYLKLDFSKRIFSSTCADELEVCQGAQYYCDINYKRHCALTCGDCLSEDQIGHCTFKEQYRGQWMDSGQNGDYIIDVDAYTIKSPNLGSYNCLNLDEHHLPDKRVLLESYDNGCLPRYACAELSKVNSSVMKFRLGKRHAWPLPNGRNQKEHICKPENFQRHNRAESRYIRERPSRLIVNTQIFKAVNCGLPEKLQNGIAFLEDGRQCRGCLNYDPSMNNTEFVVRPVNCTDDTKPSGTSNPTERDTSANLPSYPIRYSCLASFQFYNGSYSIVTKTASFNSGLGQYLVWIFTQQNQIKVMKASETYVYAHKRHLSSEYILAQFSILRNDDLKCRTNTYQRPTPASTTSSTMLSNDENVHYIDRDGSKHSHGKTTDVPYRRPDKGGRYTYYPDNDNKPYKKNEKGDEDVTPKLDTSRQENLKGNNGVGSSQYNIQSTCLVMMTVSTILTSFYCHSAGMTSLIT